MAYAVASGPRLLRGEEGESANGDHETSSETQLLLPLLLSSPWLRLNLHLVILRRNRVSAPAPEAAAGFAAPQDGCAAAALLAARSD